MVRDRSFNALGVALALNVGACVLAIAAAVLAASMRFAVTGAIALAAGLTAVVVAPYAHRVLGSRGPIYAAVTTLGAVPVVFLGAASALSEPILHDFRCGLGIMGFAIAAPVAIVFFGTPTSLAIWAVVGRSERPLLDRALRALAVPVVVAATVLVALSAVRRASKPESSGYLATLPVVAELGRDAWTVVDLSELPADKNYSGPPFTHAARADIQGGPSIYRACRDEGECHLWLRGRSEARPHTSMSWARADNELRVRRDEARDLYVLDFAAPRIAMYGDGRVRMPLYPRDVVEALASPRDWIIAAGLGVVLAIALLRRGRARERALSAMVWREGFVTGASTAIFADGTSVAIDGTLAEGTPVTARVRDALTTTFRELPGISASDLREGTLEDRAAEARAASTSHAALALLVAAVTVAPLVACIVHRVAF